ncbi:MAG: hypothetical protein ACRCZK_02410 [Oscillospiraceae bacterium]
MKNEIRRESLEITVNETLWHINVISYEGEDSPYRIISDKKEILVLSNNDHIAFHAKYTGKYINIEQKDSNMVVSIDSTYINVYNND